MPTAARRWPLQRSVIFCACSVGSRSDQRKRGGAGQVHLVSGRSGGPGFCLASDLMKNLKPSTRNLLESLAAVHCGVAKDSSKLQCRATLLRTREYSLHSIHRNSPAKARSNMAYRPWSTEYHGMESRASNMLPCKTSEALSAQM